MSVRIALIGLGYRGQGLLKLLRQIPSYEVVALCDPILKADLSSPSPIAIYNKGADDYRRMLRDLSPDLVLLALPWQEQIRVAEQCLEYGTHIALEVRGGGESLSEYDRLLELEQLSHTRVFPLENTLFLRPIMALSRMIGQGLLGDIIYLKGGYHHDLRPILLDSEALNPKAYGVPPSMGSDVPISIPPMA